MNRYYRNPDAMWREEDRPREQAMSGLEKGENVADLGTSIILVQGRMHSLNLLGTEIWKLCDGRTLDELAAALEEIFDVAPDVLRKDIVSFLTELKGLGLINEK